MKIYKILSSAVIKILFIAAMGSFNVQAMENIECPFCYHRYDEEHQRYHLLCGHHFCKKCAAVMSRKENECPFCCLSDKKTADGDALDEQDDIPLPRGFFVVGDGNICFALSSGEGILDISTKRVPSCWRHDEHCDITKFPPAKDAPPSSTDDI